MSAPEYDAVTVGSGPNGLSAAIVLQQAGLRTLLIEAKDTIGGGLRTAELTLPGFKHDVCSAIHPMAAISPFFATLPLQEHGLEYIYPFLAAAHPFDDGTAVALARSAEQTARLLGEDETTYLSLIQPTLRNWPLIVNDVLSPLRFPKHPWAMAKFGMQALTPATRLSQKFSTREGKGLWAGMAAHSIQPLSHAATSSVAMVLMTAGHLSGWPYPKGGAQSIADALASYFISIGGKINTGFTVSSLDQLPAARAILFDLTPKQLLQIAGSRFTALYKWQLKRYRYGPGVFKIDWALDGAIPWTAEECRYAGTVHVGNTFQEIARAEQEAWRGKHPKRPFVLLAQQSLFDPSRAPQGKHAVWAYCHVPNGSEADMTEAIEKQVERFAPGFRDRILARHTMNTAAMQRYNANYIGGDINGGAMDIRQLFARPAIGRSPYRTPAKGIYICSSSTPPGGGVHGMCGYHAAKQALKDVFGIG